MTVRLRWVWPYYGRHLMLTDNDGWRGVWIGPLGIEESRLWAKIWGRK